MNDTEYKRGDIYYIVSNEHTPIGCEIWSDRPAIIVSNDTLNQTSGAVEIVYLSTTLKKKPSPLHIRIQSSGRPSLAMCSQVHTIDKSRLRERLGHISDEEQKELDKALCFSLGIDAENYRGLFKKWENYIREYHIPVIEEMENIAMASVDATINTLRRQISIITKERDGYKSLAESREEKLNQIRMSSMCQIP